MKESDDQEYQKLVEIFENVHEGLFGNPNGQVPSLRFRDLFEWCQKHNRTAESLTAEELTQFKTSK